MVEDSGQLGSGNSLSCRFECQLLAWSKNHGRVYIMILPQMTRYFNCGFYYYKYNLVELIFEETKLNKISENRFPLKITHYTLSTWSPSNPTSIGTKCPSKYPALPDSQLQRSTTRFSPLSQKILDLPLTLQSTSTTKSTMYFPHYHSIY